MGAEISNPGNIDTIQAADTLASAFNCGLPRQTVKPALVHLVHAFLCLMTVLDVRRLRMGSAWKAIPRRGQGDLQDQVWQPRHRVGVYGE